jgi:hypothetical protein
VEAEDSFDTVDPALGAVAAPTNFDYSRPHAINEMCIGEAGA